MRRRSSALPRDWIDQTSVPGDAVVTVHGSESKARGQLPKGFEASVRPDVREAVTMPELCPR